MEKGNNEKSTSGCLIVFFVVFLLIFLPILIGLISNNSNTSNQAKHEAKLIEEGKTKTDNEVINEIAEILKNKNEEKLKEYLSENFMYSDNDRNQSKYIHDFISDLNYLIEDNYDIEKRGNDLKDEETYRIYWNVVEQNKNLGRTNQYYCLQKITIILKRVIKQDIITYEIEKIILTDN